jgi:hypothetical protein
LPDRAQRIRDSAHIAIDGGLNGRLDDRSGVLLSTSAELALRAEVGDHRGAVEIGCVL